MPPTPWPPVATFSILGYDPATGEVGGAVQSRVFSVGNGVLWAEAGVGVAATQAIVGCVVRAAGHCAAARRHEAGRRDQEGVGERPRSASDRLDEVRPAVRRDRHAGQCGRLYRPQGQRVGRRQAGEVLHGAGQYSRRARRGERDGEGVRGNAGASVAAIARRIGSRPAGRW
ncbi:MAG: DUF1028 domain-containing protein [Gemmatimonas sp.]|nr:DUF1028 domain-containing protein [Gemmatimonas sp.]